MAEGVEVEISDGRARITFVDRASRATHLARLVELAGAGRVAVDTGGARRTYIVAESVAVAAGLVDKPGRRKSSRRSGQGSGADAITEQSPAHEG